MKRTIRPTDPGTAQARAPSGDIEAVIERVRLAFLDDYTCEKRGYDPYDTSRYRAVPDIWVNKRKRA